MARASWSAVTRAGSSWRAAWPRSRSAARRTRWRPRSRACRRRRARSTAARDLILGMEALAAADYFVGTSASAIPGVVQARCPCRVAGAIPETCVHAKLYIVSLAQRTSER